MKNNSVSIFSLFYLFFLLQIKCHSINTYDCDKTDNGITNKEILPSEIAIVMIIETENNYNDYKLAIQSVQCYSLRYGYTFELINFSLLPKMPLLCPQEDFLFARHCVTSIYMEEHSEKIKYVFSLDADIGIINPLHRLEELISKEDIIFTRRIQSHEIAASPYIVKNNIYGRIFLKHWANFYYKMPPTLHVSDNGGLMGLFLIKLKKTKQNKLYNTCLYLFSTSKSHTDYRKFCVCVNSVLEELSQLCKNDDSQYFDEGKIKVLSKKRTYKTFVRDIWNTKSRWALQDFMLHGLKEKNRHGKVKKYVYWKNPLKNNGFQLNKCYGLKFIDQWKYVPKLVKNNVTITNYLMKTIESLKVYQFKYKKEIKAIVTKNNLYNDSSYYVRSAFQLENSSDMTILFLSEKQNGRLKIMQNLNEIHINNFNESINDNLRGYTGVVSVGLFNRDIVGVKKIVIKKEHNKLKNIAVCSPILQNFELAGKCLQFIKYWLSVDKSIDIYVYFHSWTKKVGKMMKKIRKYKKNVKIVSWSNLPYHRMYNHVDPNFDIIDKGQQLAYLDCLLRNKNKVKYVVLTKLDQEVVHDNIIQLLDKMSSDNMKAQIIKIMLQDEMLNKRYSLKKGSKLKFLNPNLYSMIIFLPERIELPLKKEYEIVIVNETLAYTRLVGYQRVTFMLSKRKKLIKYSKPLVHWTENYLIKPYNSWIKY